MCLCSRTQARAEPSRQRDTRSGRGYFPTGSHPSSPQTVAVCRKHPPPSDVCTAPGSGPGWRTVAPSSLFVVVVAVLSVLLEFRRDPAGSSKIQPALSSNGCIPRLSSAPAVARERRWFSHGSQNRRFSRSPRSSPWPVRSIVSLRRKTPYLRGRASALLGSIAPNGRLRMLADADPACPSNSSYSLMQQRRRMRCPPDAFSRPTDACSPRTCPVQCQPSDTPPRAS
jgi:hypothetical protein